MRWPWSKTEQRESGGDYAEAVLRLIEATAAGTAANVTKTAAVEAACGSLSRAFQGATVKGPDWVQRCVSPIVLGQIGRDLMRAGQSMHVIRMDRGEVQLVPCANWHWEGDHQRDNWTVRATAYGPSTSTTWNLPASAVVFLTYGSMPGQPYVGIPPTSWASLTAKLSSEADRSIGDEAAGPLAQLIGVPADGGDGSNTDSLKMLKADLTAARGKAALVETTSDGWADGKDAAPRKDWKAERLGPTPPAGLIEARRDAYMAILAACGSTPGDLSADGTAQREILRRWHMETVEPLAALLAHELSLKLGAEVMLEFDRYPTDLAGRAQAFAKLVAGGMSMEKAAGVSGVLVTDDE